MTSKNGLTWATNSKSLYQQLRNFKSSNCPCARHIKSQFSSLECNICCMRGQHGEESWLKCSTLQTLRQNLARGDTNRIEISKQISVLAGTPTSWLTVQSSNHQTKVFAKAGNKWSTALLSMTFRLIGAHYINKLDC